MSASTIISKLDAYRSAIKESEWVTEHGSHGDGRLTQALRHEKEARADLLLTIRMEGKAIANRELAGGVITLREYETEN